MQLHRPREYDDVLLLEIIHQHAQAFIKQNGGLGYELVWKFHGMYDLFVRSMKQALERGIDEADHIGPNKAKQLKQRLEEYVVSEFPAWFKKERGTRFFEGAASVASQLGIHFEEWLQQEGLTYSSVEELYTLASMFPHKTGIRYITPASIIYSLAHGKFSGMTVNLEDFLQKTMGGSEAVEALYTELFPVLAEAFPYKAHGMPQSMVSARQLTWVYKKEIDAALLIHSEEDLQEALDANAATMILEEKIASGTLSEHLAIAKKVILSYYRNRMSAAAAPVEEVPAISADEQIIATVRRLLENESLIKKLQKHRDRKNAIKTLRAKLQQSGIAIEPTQLMELIPEDIWRNLGIWS